MFKYIDTNNFNFSYIEIRKKESEGSAKKETKK